MKDPVPVTPPTSAEGTGPLDADNPSAAPVPDNEMSETTTHERPEAIERWRAAKFGLFLHWGVYSVYGGTYRGEELNSAEWIQENARMPWAEYSRAAADWNPDQFDAEEWVAAARSAGMRYLVVTSKHHDGFAMYPSKASGYNLMAWSKYRGPDPMAALKAACRKHGLLFGIYYSPLEFRVSPNGFNEEDEKAVAAGFDYASLGPEPHATNADVVELAQAQIRELAEWYEPDIMWFDGTWDKMGRWTEADGLQAERAIRAAVPDVLINNRLGLKDADFNTFEGELPEEAPGGVWEYCWNLGCFWGYNPRNYEPWPIKTPEHYIETLVKTASLGGNYLLNVGPDPTGRFHPMATSYLNAIGEWTRANGECVYDVSASPLLARPDWGYVTSRPGRLYLILKDWGNSIAFPALKAEPEQAYLLLDPDREPIPVSQDKETWTLQLPPAKPTEPFAVVVVEVEATKADGRS